MAFLAGKSLEAKASGLSLSDGKLCLPYCEVRRLSLKRQAHMRWPL